MKLPIPVLPHFATVIALGLSLPSVPAQAQGDAEQALATTIIEMEDELEARNGVFISDSTSDWHWGHRENERFLMASTFKSVLCAAVLERVDDGMLSLGDDVEVRAGELHGYDPVTRERVGGTMQIDDLCLATLDMSDNGAANLLIDRLGGPGEVTAFLRRVGDQTTRLDRKEPDVNLFAPGDPRDTTSPAAMAATWEEVLVGDALAPASRARLAEWMSHGGVTGALIRAHTPEDWSVSDKSGGGSDYTRNIVAMLTPNGHAPYFVSIYLSDTPADWDARNAAVSKLGAAVIGVIASRPQAQP